MTIAQRYCNDNLDSNILFFSTPLALDKKIINQSGIVSYHQIVPFYYKPNSFIEYVRCAIYAIISFCTAIKDLVVHQPDRLITTGGICSIPVVFAAFCLSIPVDMYVLDAVPGKALIALEPFASHIYCCFDSAKNYFTKDSVSSVSYPVRYSDDQLCMTKEKAYNKLCLDVSKKTILILGGSQGSVFLNDIILQWITDNPDYSSTINIIHQYGNDTRYDFKKWYERHQVNAISFDYASDLSFYYAAADLVIARAGAGTIFELHAFSKKTILIPLCADSTAHQIDNAQSIVQMYPNIFTCLLQKDIEFDHKPFYKKMTDVLS